MEETTFWQEYIRKVGENASFEEPKYYRDVMISAHMHFDQAVANLRKELAKIPIGAEIENWLRNHLPETHISKFEKSMIHLIKFGLLKLTHNGQVRTLNDLIPQNVYITSDEHERTIEQIRCLPKLTTPEKETAVNAYTLFSQHLYRVTGKLLFPGEDPDFQRTTKKIVGYNEFIEFVQLLPKRDGLIAKLLYFGAPTMDEVLNLKISQVDLKSDIVKYNKFSVRYPKYVMIELRSYLTKKEKDELIFMNLHGERIERTHLNNCFNRASRKTAGKTRITPKMLLESDIANSTAAHWPFASYAIQ